MWRNCATRWVWTNRSACSTSIILRAWRAEIGAGRIAFAAPVRADRAAALSRDARIVSGGADRLRRHRDSRGSFFRATPRQTARPRNFVLHFAGPFRSEFRARTVLILIFSVELGWLPVSGRGGVSHLILPAVTLGAGARGDPHAHGSRFDDRRTFQRLRAHRARQRHYRNVGPVPPRVSERADSHDHHRRTAIWIAAGRNHCHRNNFFLAGNRAAGGAGHFGA